MSNRKGFVVDVALCCYCNLRPVYSEGVCRPCADFIIGNGGKLPGPAPERRRRRKQKDTTGNLFLIPGLEDAGFLPPSDEGG
jgi:hypothetical protein